MDIGRRAGHGTRIEVTLPTTAKPDDKPNQITRTAQSLDDNSKDGGSTAKRSLDWILQRSFAILMKWQQPHATNNPTI